MRLCLAMMVDKRPDKSLRNLFAVEGDLTAMINLAAIRYGKGSHVKHRLMNYHHFFIHRVRPREKVLDVGCGDGSLAYDIVRRTGADVTGIDINMKSIEACRARFTHPSLRFKRMDVTQGVPDERYDAIVLSNVLEHIQDRVGFLMSLRKRCHPTRFLIRVPMIDRSWYVPMRRELGLPYFSDDTHCVEYTLDSFQLEMSAAGLGISHYQINWGEIWAEVQNA
jgi:SAM-dependent methyltransferase